MSESDRRSNCSSGGLLGSDVIVGHGQRDTDHDQRTDDGPEASLATRIMATSAASGVTARRPPILGDPFTSGMPNDGHVSPVFGPPV